MNKKVGIWLCNVVLILVEVMMVCLFIAYARNENINVFFVIDNTIVSAVWGYVLHEQYIKTKEIYKSH